MLSSKQRAEEIGIRLHSHRILVVSRDYFEAPLDGTVVDGVEGSHKEEDGNPEE